IASSSRRRSLLAPRLLAGVALLLALLLLLRAVVGFFLGAAATAAEQTLQKIRRQTAHPGHAAHAWHAAHPGHAAHTWHPANPGHSTGTAAAESGFHHLRCDALERLIAAALRTHHVAQLLRHLQLLATRDLRQH